MKNNHRTAVLLLIIFSLVVNWHTSTDASSSRDLKKDDPRVVGIIGKVKRTISSNNFSNLKLYADAKEKIEWSSCGPSDDYPSKYSYDEITAMLLNILKKSSVAVSREADVYLWSSKENSYMVHVHTEGWEEEYPYVTFLFKFLQKEQKWKWYGVCYSKVSPSVIKKTLGM